MLQLKNIVKTYVAGDTKQDALKGVSMNFRENEFVSILGQSGSGKTTLLNIIGGLDRYTSGDLIINGVSTSKYKDADWDYYRNHSIGFVFQSYNLIPHQSVLSNVELALTLAGISKKERRARAIEVLKKVGLADHIHKRPNQMSGGQMQRVAIARALINNPDILLADEPTGALDSETSVQIMELLKEIAKDKLVIMVTHNPELAAKYSTRIIRVLDGRIVDDTDPYNVPDQISVTPQKRKKISMSMGTAVSLSFNNLKTKKGRTLLTAFAGSIGIIGIALILSLSTGIQDYVNDLQRDTLSSYPVSIAKEESPLASILTAAMPQEDGDNADKKENTVYSNSRMGQMFNAMFASDSDTNNLTKFKAYLEEKMAEEPEKKDSDVLKDHVETIQYQYDVALNTYIETEDGYRSTDMTSVFMNGMTSSSSTGSDSSENSMASMMGMSSSSMSQMSSSMMSLWSELLPGNDGELISDMVYDQYDLEAGRWPEAANELVYPVLVRPSYVLGGQGMQIAVSDEDVVEFMNIINRIKQDHPILVDKYLMGKEIEVDAVCDGQDILIPGIMEHIERAGIHSGDSISVYPAKSISPKIVDMIEDYTGRLARALHVKGMINIQFIVYNDQVYVIEVNPRSSRTVPYISKVTGIPIVKLATQVIIGKTIKELGYEPGLQKAADYYAIKMPVFSFEKIRGADISLGPEMKSTGECLGISKSFDEALYKAFEGAGIRLPKHKQIIMTLADKDKQDGIDIAQRFEALGYKIYASRGTAKVLKENGVHAIQVNKIGQEAPTLLDLILEHKIDLVIDTPENGIERAKDGFLIRRYAIETGVHCLTSLDTAHALISSLEHAFNNQELSIVDIAKIDNRGNN